jgi:hypothetical protein
MRIAVFWWTRSHAPARFGDVRWRDFLEVVCVQHTRAAPLHLRRKPVCGPFRAGLPLDQGLEGVPEVWADALNKELLGSEETQHRISKDDAALLAKLSKGEQNSIAHSLFWWANEQITGAGITTKSGKST